jgi:hypothetical protein
VKLPVWRFELVRDTNAPYALVREALLDGERYYAWHPRHRSVNPEIIEDGECLEIVCRMKGFAFSEEATYRVERLNGRLLLTFRNRFKGWPVIPMMGWWRLKTERIWERLIASLPQEYK